MSTGNRWLGTGAAIVLAVAVATPQAMAAPTTWNSATLGYWTNAANWTGGLPGAGDDVFFTNSANGIAIIDGDVTINSLDVNAYTGQIVFTNTAAANLTISSNLTLGSGATIVPQYSSVAGNGAGRIITVGSNAVIAGTINGNGHGFANGAGPTFAGNSSGHGGLSGGGSVPYGSLTQPTELGGGGRTTSVNNKGGGAIKLVVGGTLTLNGSITMNATGDGHSGAAGGSVWLIATTLAGNGQIAANAYVVTGPDGNDRGGGGGRVAIEYTNSTFSGNVSVAPGLLPGTLTYAGQPGTLWAPASFLAPTGSLGSPQAVTITNSFQFYAADTNSTLYWDLTVTGAWVEFHSNTLVLSALSLGGGANVRFDMLRSGANGIRGLSVTNGITLAAGTNWLYLPAEGSYNLPGGLSVGTGANLYLFGNTGTVNGVGVTITAQTATVNGTVSGRGFPAGTGLGFYQNSGSHGGYSGNAGTVYGSLTQPTSLGSGGRTTGANYGGGALRLDVAGVLTVNGRIGMDGAGDGFAGSAGGSLWLIANTLTGSGTVSANAGVMTSADANNRGGGGGRIAIEYTSSTFSGAVSAAGGNSLLSIGYYGQPGTVWAPKNFLWASGTPGSPQSVTITNSYQFYASDDTNAVYYWDLSLSSGWVEFHSNTLYLSNLLLTNNANLRFDRLLTGLRDIQGLSISNNITLAAGTNYLYLPAEGSYALSGDLFVGTNALLYAFGNTGAVNAAAGGLTNNPYGIGLTITAQTATVNGTITGQGFPGGKGPTFNYSSSGHGGLSGSGSLTYGSLTRPTELGSGGYSVGYYWMRGGGAVKLVVAGTLTVNGVINMNGVPLSGSGVLGGGAGGSIWLITDTLAGAGAISANGGIITHGDGNARGGGGGRIALEYAASTFSGIVSAAGATNAYPAGKTGTLFTCQSPWPLADSDGFGGVALATALSVSSHTNGMRVTRTVNKWTPSGPSLSWTDTSMDWFSNPLTNMATYTVSGLALGTRFTIYTNNVTYAVTNTGASNAIAFAIALTDPCTIRVQGPVGTVFVIH